jgi:hypothetical protein
VAKTKIFVSFDYDEDRALRDFIVGQAKLPDSPFEVADYSLKEATREAVWERKARTAISRADKFVVMLGPRTRFAPGVKNASPDVPVGHAPSAGRGGHSPDSVSFASAINASGE